MFYSALNRNLNYLGLYRHGTHLWWNDRFHRWHWSVGLMGLKLNKNIILDFHFCATFDYYIYNYSNELLIKTDLLEFDN